jgi:hypothetical protein
VVVGDEQARRHHEPGTERPLAVGQLADDPAHGAARGEPSFEEADAEEIAGGADHPLHELIVDVFRLDLAVLHQIHDRLGKIAHRDGGLLQLPDAPIGDLGQPTPVFDLGPFSFLGALLVLLALGASVFPAPGGFNREIDVEGQFVRGRRHGYLTVLSMKRKTLG